MKSHIRKEFAEVARELAVQKPKKKKNKNKSGANLNRMDSMSRDFACALKMPFHPCAVGCRVPDIYSAPTSTFHVRGNVVIGATSAGTLGVVLLPNPILSLIDAALDNSSLSCVTSGMTQLPNAGGAGASPYFGATSVAVASASLSSYRVASWGLKISNLQAVLSATGKLYIAIIPSISEVPTLGDIAGSLSDNGNGYATKSFTGSPGIYSNTILDFPEATLLPVSELVSGAVCVSPTPVNPVFYNFKSLNQYCQISSSNYMNTQVVTAVSGAPFSIRGGLSLNNISGGSTVVIYGDGFPVSSANVLDIEYVYHLEGTPILSVSNSAGFSAATPQQHVGSTDVVEKALQLAPANQAITFLTGAQQLGAMAGKAYNAAKDFSQTPLGGAMASAMMALF